MSTEKTENETLTIKVAGLKKGLLTLKDEKKIAKNLNDTRTSINRLIELEADESEIEELNKALLALDKLEEGPEDVTTSEAPIKPVAKPKTRKLSKADKKAKKMFGYLDKQDDLNNNPVQCIKDCASKVGSRFCFSCVIFNDKIKPLLVIEKD